MLKHHALEDAWNQAVGVQNVYKALRTSTMSNGNYIAPPIDFPKSMDSQTKEVMDILQEECAEVIQAVSKISRFGLDNFKPGKPKTNREHLEEELGDMLAMIDILHSMDIVSYTNIERAQAAKIEKLKKWSNIQNLENI